MLKHENHCVGCPDGIPCLGSSCPYISVTVYYCDRCGYDNAEYEYDDEDICEECLKKQIVHEWEFKTKDEKRKLLSVNEDITEEELDDIFESDCTLHEKIEILDMYVIKR